MLEALAEQIRAEMVQDIHQGIEQIYQELVQLEKRRRRPVKLHPYIYILWRFDRRRRVGQEISTYRNLALLYHLCVTLCTKEFCTISDKTCILHGSRYKVERADQMCELGQI